MKKILMLAYAVCAMLVIAGSLLWFVFTLRSDSQTGKAEALKTFKVFTQRTAKVLADPAVQSESTRLHTMLEQLCLNYRTHIQTVLIKNEAGIVFVWPQSSDIFSYHAQDKDTVEIKNMPLFFTAAQMHIPARTSGGSFTVHAALQTLSAETIFNRGQTVFLLVLALVLMTITVLLFVSIDNRPQVKNVTVSSAKQADFFVSGIPASSAPAEKTAAQSAQTEPTVEVKDSSETESPSKATTVTAYEPHQAKAPKSELKPPILPLSAQLESLNRLHIYDDSPENPVQTDHPETTPQEKKHPAENTPAPHFNAENYGSFEKHTQPAKPVREAAAAQDSQPVNPFHNSVLADAERNSAYTLEQTKLIEELTTAIMETAVAEEDLALMLIRAKDISHNQQIIHLMRTTLDHIHNLFIFNQDTLGLIVFYASLDRAMQIASNLYDEVSPLLDAPNKTALGIGLTTRAGRLIPAHRMMEEAVAAAGKALEEGGDPIVAFRVNPDKYRRCLARLS